MLQRLWKAMRQQEGFTLLEVLVVIAILGIIAAIITPKFLDVMRGARVDTVKASAKQIQMGLERYNFTNNHYPPSSGTDPDVIVDYGDLATVLSASVALPTPTSPAFDMALYQQLNSGSSYNMILSVTGANNGTTVQCINITQDAITTGTIKTTSPITCTNP